MWIVSNGIIFGVCCVAEIWQALKATTEVDRDMKLQIIESAGIIVQSADMTVCYDERGKFDIVLKLCREIP